MCFHFLKKVSGFQNSISGNVAMTFALSALPIFVVAGFAIDFERQFSMQHRVQVGLDAAALATTLRLNEVGGMEQEALNSVAQEFFDGNFPSHAELTLNPVEASTVGDEVMLSVRGTLDTTFMEIIGQKTMPVGASTGIVYNIQRPVELALVLDTSESMAGSKLTALQDASRELIDILLPNEDDPSANEAAKMSVVPFNDYVRIDTSYKNAGWIRDTESYTTESESCSTSNEARIEAGCYQEQYTCQKTSGSVEQGNQEQYTTTCTRWVCPEGAEPEKTCSTKYKYYEWQGCMLSRAYPYNTTDASYATHPISGFQHTGNWCKNNVGLSKEMTSNHADMDQIIGSLKAKRKTYIPTGLIWGLRSLSSHAPFEGAEDYTSFAAEDGRKVLMLMSDGANTVSPKSSGKHNNSDTAKSNSYTEEICDEIKAQGIEVFTIAFELEDDDTKDMLKDCATDESHYYDADNAAELSEAFVAVGRDLAELAISQ